MSQRAEPKVPYRETIIVQGEGQHRHKKQTGGRGQFGEAHLRVYPLPREIKSKEQFFEEIANKSRFEKFREDFCQYDPEHNFGFVDTIVGGTIPNQFIPGVQKGSYTMEFSHYDQVPGNIQKQIVDSAKVAADEEE